MWQTSTDCHQSKYREFSAFVAHTVMPCAEQWDRDQRIPAGVIAELAQGGYLGATLLLSRSLLSRRCRLARR